MKRLTALLLAGGLATTATAGSIEQRLDADPESIVSISNTAGSVEVRGWSRSEVEVSGTLGEDVDELIFERDGDEIEIKVRGKSRGWGRSDITSRLKIRVPEGSSLEIGTVSADIEVQGVTGQLELQTVSGRIDSELFGEDAEFGTVSGSIDVEGDGRTSDVEINSVSGRITAENLAGDVRAENVSGGITIADGSFENVHIETVNGRVIFRAGLEADGDLTAESVNGSVKVDISNPLAGHYDIESFNGRISNCFGRTAERTSKYAPGRRLAFKSGSGRASVRIETLNGSIDVCAE